MAQALKHSVAKWLDDPMTRSPAGSILRIELSKIGWDSRYGAGGGPALFNPKSEIDNPNWREFP